MLTPHRSNTYGFQKRSWKSSRNSNRTSHRTAVAVAIGATEVTGVAEVVGVVVGDEAGAATRTE